MPRFHPCMGHGLVGDVLRGVRISTHLQNQSILVQALQSRTTNLGKRPPSTQIQPLQFSCTSLVKLCHFFFGHVCRPWPSWVIRNRTEVAATPSLDTEHRTRTKKQFLSLNIARMMQYHQILANKTKSDNLQETTVIELEGSMTLRWITGGMLRLLQYASVTSIRN